MIFHPRQKKVNVNVPLTLENTVIKQVTETKFLGVLIDQHLSWKPHIDFVSKQISESVRIIAKARFYLSSQTLMTLYYSLVYPFLTYCNVAWSSTYCSNLNCIYLLKKRLVRLITKAHYLANTVPLFSQLKVLDMFSINSFSVATFMYSYHHNLLPSSFRDLFLSSNQGHQYETRLASQYRPNFCRTNIKQFSILYGGPIRGPKIWNSLPVSLISFPSIFVFKKFLKNYLIDSRSVA